MVAIKYFVLLIVVLCEAKKSLVPQAILQLVRSKYGDSSLVIRIFHDSMKVNILDETLKLLSNEKQMKITLIDMNELFDDELENCVKIEGEHGKPKYPYPSKKKIPMGMGTQKNIVHTS